MGYINLLKLAHSFWQKQLGPSDNAIDATCGNGRDTLFLAKILPQGTVFALDVQKKALENTEKLIRNELYHKQNPNVVFLQKSHADLITINFQRPIKLVAYNLGYLPGSDKTLTTLTSTTIASLNQAISLLSVNGALSIVCYPGHPEGQKETPAVSQWLENLKNQNPNHFEVSQFKSSDSPTAPIFFWLLKKQPIQTEACNASL